jgi:hypothetical protein
VRLEAQAASFELETPFAVVMVSSLDGRILSQSRHILVSTSADARWTGVEVSQDGDEILSTGHWPFLMQPVEGRITVKGEAPAMVYRLAANGERLGELATEATTDGLVIPLSAESRCMHYEIVREP